MPAVAIARAHHDVVLVVIDLGADRTENLLHQGLPLNPALAHAIANDLWEIGAVLGVGSPCDG